MRRVRLMAIQGFDVGDVIRYRLTDTPWQYEALVRWGDCAGPETWHSVISLSLVQYQYNGAGRPIGA